jgi:phage terminase large subunit-like protein
MSASLAQRAATLPADEPEAWLTSLSPVQVTALLADWEFCARPAQLAPPGAWTVWLIHAGRGFGTTRAGAEWVLDRIAEYAEPGPHRVALVARTAAGTRDVMVAGESGLAACAERRGWTATHEPSKRRVMVTTPTGTVGICTTYSAEEPDQLRGPQQHSAWCDELAARRAITDAQGNSAWTNLQFGLRLGIDPRVVITTTPRPTPEMRALVKDGRVVVTKGTTDDNLANLAPAFRDAVLARYEGTMVGRQELNAEMLEDVEGALWKLADLDAGRISGGDVPSFQRVVVAVDPSATTSRRPIRITGHGNASTRACS